MLSVSFICMLFLPFLLSQLIVRHFKHFHYYYKITSNKLDLITINVPLQSAFIPITNHKQIIQLPLNKHSKFYLKILETRVSTTHITHTLHSVQNNMLCLGVHTLKPINMKSSNLEHKRKCVSWVKNVWVFSVSQIAFEVIRNKCFIYLITEYFILFVRKDWSILVVMQEIVCGVRWFENYIYFVTNIELEFVKEEGEWSSRDLSPICHWLTAEMASGFHDDECTTTDLSNLWRKIRLIWHGISFTKTLSHAFREEIGWSNKLFL